MKHICLVILCFLICGKTHANKIDAIKTDVDATDFIKGLLKDKPQDFKLVTYLNFTKYSEVIKEDVKSWVKADLNNDGLTDLVIMGRVINTPWSWVVMDKGKQGFKIIKLSCYMAECELARIVQMSNQPTILFYSFIHNTGGIGLETKDTLIVDTLVYKFDSLIEYNSSPNRKPISEISFKTGACFGICPVFSFNITSNGNATYVGGSYNELQGRFRTYIPPQSLRPFMNIINYSVGKLKNNYDCGATDNPTCWLTVKFSDGTVKEIEDYGERGTLALIKLYAMFFQLRKNQDWHKQYGL